MDIKVLECQELINNRYRDVKGFKLSPEDGKPSWTFIHTLRMALQIELGITALSTAFGPTTSRLWDEKKYSVLKTQNGKDILSAVCWTSGYNGFIKTAEGELPLGISKFRGDVGLERSASIETLDAKLMKSLFSMDAFVLLSGGAKNVRRVQQELNREFRGVTSIPYAPCDGLPSRNLMKTLIKGVQYRLGSTPDGVLGSKTATALKESISRNDKKILHLFKCGLAIYQNFDIDNQNDFQTQLREFRQFHQLSSSNLTEMDYDTYMELLSSRGNPDRQAHASDAVQEITTARAKTLKGQGIRIIGRYLMNTPSELIGGKTPLDKEIKKRELTVMQQEGLRYFPIFQFYGGSSEYFTSARGTRDARLASNRAIELGIPAGSCIYFAVDYDAMQSDIDNALVGYFSAVSAQLRTMGTEYIMGIYGPRHVCDEIRKKCGARFSFVSGMSKGFSGNLGYDLPVNWSFNQIKEITAGTGDGKLGLDRVVWRGSPSRKYADPGVDPSHKTHDDISLFVESLASLEKLAVEYSRKAYSKHPNILVSMYLRSLNAKYDNITFNILVGNTDKEFISHAKSALTEQQKGSLEGYTDRVSGTKVGADHFGCTLHGLFRSDYGDWHGDDHKVLQFLRKEALFDDFIGWSGDLTTLFGEWARLDSVYESGYIFVQDYFAQIDTISTFKLEDLLQDALAYLVRHDVSSGSSISESVARRLAPSSSGKLLDNFLELRFDSLNQDVINGLLSDTINSCLSFDDWDGKNILHHLLLARDVVGSGDIGRVLTNVANNLRHQKFDPFVEGFVHRLNTLAERH